MQKRANANQRFKADPSHGTVFKIAFRKALLANLIRTIIRNFMVGGKGITKDINAREN